MWIPPSEPFGTPLAIFFFFLCYFCGIFCYFLLFWASVFFLVHLKGGAAIFFSAIFFRVIKATQKKLYVVRRNLIDGVAERPWAVALHRLQGDASPGASVWLRAAVD